MGTIRFTGRMEKVDFKRDRSDLYAPPTSFVEVDVPEFFFLAVDGSGDPNTVPEYAEAVQALFTMSYALKFASKRQLERDWVVPPLEGLWWADDPVVFAEGSRGDWNWTMLVRQPQWLTDDVKDAAFVAAGKKNLPAFHRVRQTVLTEGRSVQILHLGPYAHEARTIAALHQEYLPQHGLVHNGQHHEVYLSDPRRTDPAKLKTILRQPVRSE